MLSSQTRATIRFLVDQDEAATPEDRSRVKAAIAASEPAASAWAPPELVSESAAAELLSVSYVYLWRWRQGKSRGRQPRPFPFAIVRNGAGQIRYRADEVRAYAQRLLSPVPPPPTEERKE